MINDTKTLKHIRIYNWLREMIDRGRFLADEKLPTEIEIAKKFGVNRMTVRQAMDMLVNEGIINRKRGKGTFLLKKPDKVNYLLDNIISFEGIAKEHNFKSKYEVIHRSVETASFEIASIFSVLYLGMIYLCILRQAISHMQSSKSFWSLILISQLYIR